jgi:hypothetical protein
VQKFAEAFVRNPDGSWFCRARAEFVAPDGERMNVTPGASYRRGKLYSGQDIARWLDDWNAHRAVPPGVVFL